MLSARDTALVKCMHPQKNAWSWHDRDYVDEICDWRLFTIMENHCDNRQLRLKSIIATTLLPSIWRMIEEPAIGLFICGCGEETSNITKGVFTMVFCGVFAAEVFCDALGVVWCSIAVNLLLRPLISVICIMKKDKVSLKETSGHA